MRLLLIIACLVVCACSTDYHRPDAGLPDRFSTAGSDQTAEGQAKPWWQRYNDPELNALMASGLERNTDIAVAGWRLYQARQTENTAFSNRLPQVAGSVGAARTSAGNNFTVNGSVSFDADLWGHLALAQSAADWQARAGAQDLAATELALTHDLAAAYLNIAFLHEQITLAEAGLAYQRRVLDLIRAGY